MRVPLMIILLLCLSLLGSCSGRRQGSDIEGKIFRLLENDPALKRERIVMTLTESRNGAVTIKMLTGDRLVRERLFILTPAFPSHAALQKILDCPDSLTPSIEILQGVVDDVLRIKGVRQVRLTGVINSILDRAEELCQRKQYTEALILYHQAAEEGLAQAQYCLGVFYLTGKAVACDVRKAVQWLERAAIQDYPEALHALGVIYQYGPDVRPNLAKARACYERAAELGLRQSQVNLARMYEYGWGVERLPEKARELFEDAAAQGDVYALTNLGLMYERGEGTPRNYARALDYYQQAAACDSMLGYSSLAWLFATCSSPEFRDPRKALEYAEKAVALVGQDPDNAWMAWDSAAAAQARNGQFDQAVEAAERAIALLQESRAIMESERQRELADARARLELYRQRQTYISRPEQKVAGEP